VTLRLRDTLTRTVHPVEPIEPGLVRMYSCGPTVYRYAHVGNLRTFLLADLIRRALLWHGVAVLHGAANLSGQQREYLREQLRAYRSGRRQDAQMNIVAKTLTDADIENFADWYSTIKVTVETPK